MERKFAYWIETMNDYSNYDQMTDAGRIWYNWLKEKHLSLTLEERCSFMAAIYVYNEDLSVTVYLPPLKQIK